MPTDDDDEKGDKTDPATPSSKVRRTRHMSLLSELCSRCGHPLLRHTEKGDRRCLYGARQADGKPRADEDTRCGCLAFVPQEKKK